MEHEVGRNYGSATAIIETERRPESTRSLWSKCQIFVKDVATIVNE
jgi:hypothetical protein